MFQAFGLGNRGGLRRPRHHRNTSAEEARVLRMMENAKKGKFDLIITREVSRFARNTVDALSYTRQMKAMGVDVLFINDGINTATNDGELRLTIMSSMAQDESRKISERVKAGQKISREKHVLYGSGNILGYRRENGTYVPDPDQAETVRLIFQMYSTGENGDGSFYDFI